MRELWAKGNIWLLTIVAAAVGAWMALSWTDMQTGQKALVFFLLALTLHEWEEMRFPGGFYELMLKKFGVTSATQMQKDFSHGAVVIAIAFFSLIPIFVWPYAPWIAGIPAVLGFFEAIIHIVGIKIHHLAKPYSPGMATALLLMLPAAIGIVAFAMPGVSWAGWLAALGSYVAIFVCMDIAVWRIFGLSPREVASSLRGE